MYDAFSNNVVWVKQNSTFKKHNRLCRIPNTNTNDVNPLWFKQDTGTAKENDYDIYIVPKTTNGLEIGWIKVSKPIIKFSNGVDL